MAAAPKVDPRTGNITWPSSQRGIPMAGPPLRARSRGIRFRGFGDVPANTGAASGSLIPIYNETEIFNPVGLNNGSGSGTVSQSTASTPDPAATGYLPASAPFGESDRAWTNPSTFASVPINAATNTQVPVLTQNYQRNALIIQNGSTAQGTDVAPILYINFNAQPIVGSSLALAPGQGIAWDVITPRDSVYIAFGPFVNTGGTVVIQGAVITGTYSP